MTPAEERAHERALQHAVAQGYLRAERVHEAWTRADARGPVAQVLGQLSEAQRHELEQVYRESLARGGSSGLPKPGGRLGAYTIVRELGQGGMGAVFVALDPLAREVALKVSLPCDAKARARFRVEAEATAALQHPGVVGIHRVGERGAQAWIAMELLPGESLAARLEREGPLPVAEVVRVGVALAETLAHCHARGVVHRDLKPHNVQLTPDGRVVLLDFGVAQLAGGQGLTQTGELLGTVGYMAPEQVNGLPGAVGPAVDVYGIGAVLHHCAGGAAPFQGTTALNTAHAVLHEPPPPLSEVPSWLHDVVRTCLAKDPAARYPSVEALGRALRAPAPRRRVGGVAGVAALACVAWAVGSMWQEGSGGEGVSVVEGSEESGEVSRVRWVVEAWGSVEGALAPGQLAVCDLEGWSAEAVGRVEVTVEGGEADVWVCAQDQEPQPGRGWAALRARATPELPGVVELRGDHWSLRRRSPRVVVRAARERVEVRLRLRPLPLATPIEPWPETPPLPPEPALTLYRALRDDVSSDEAWLRVVPVYVRLTKGRAPSERERLGFEGLVAVEGVEALRSELAASGLRREVVEVWAARLVVGRGPEELAWEVARAGVEASPEAPAAWRSLAVAEERRGRGAQARWASERRVMRFAQPRFGDRLDLAQLELAHPGYRAVGEERLRRLLREENLQDRAQAVAALGRLREWAWVVEAAPSLLEVGVQELGAASYEVVWMRYLEGLLALGRLEEAESALERVSARTRGDMSAALRLGQRVTAARRLRVLGAEGVWERAAEAVGSGVREVARWCAP